MNFSAHVDGKVLNIAPTIFQKTAKVLEMPKFWYVVFAVILLIFILIKIPLLPLPYFWDEAWPYGTAVRMMHENGISLLPGAIPAEISRGHPLLFHALAASWMKIFGTSLTASHIFPLMVSLVLILFTFVFGKYFFSGTVASIASILLMVQPVFLAQSGLLLPEILVALLMMLSLFAFIREKYFTYIIFASMLCLTKESGVVLFPVLIFGVLLDAVKLNKMNLRSISFKLAIILVPLIIAALFFVYQKKIFGWYFFPEHTAGISIQPEILFHKLENYFSYLFIYQHRNLIAISTLFTTILFYKKGAGFYVQNRIIILLLVLIVIYLLFSSLCFYSPRYILSCIPAFVIIASYFLVEASKKSKLFFLLVPMILISQISYSFKHQSNDHHLSYLNCVKVNQQVVDYCEENNFYDKKIFTHFLMRESLTNNYAGYLLKEPFLKVISEFNSTADYCIFSDYEYSSEFDSIKIKYPLKLIKRFEINKTWSEIYEVVKP